MATGTRKCVVLLSGGIDSATTLAWALDRGFERENLLTPEAAAAWERWKAENGEVTPRIDVDNHDTIGLLALDGDGNLSGACTTSGAAFKYHGRVGDSPIIGARPRFSAWSETTRKSSGRINRTRCPVFDRTSSPLANRKASSGVKVAPIMPASVE